MNIFIIKGDLTKIKADAIVNAANSQLIKGSGVDGAIHEVAGPELEKECLRIKHERFPRGLPAGEAIFTKAYNLPAKIVIHTIGPRYYSENLDLLKNCYYNSLRLAEENNCNSIAFPSISTGAHGAPISKTIQIVKEIVKHFKSDIIKEIIFVLYTQEDYDFYKGELDSKF